MKDEDCKTFTEIVVGFAELKGRELSAATIELYWRTMQSWSIEEFRAVAQVLLQRCAWMPTPKDFEDLRRSATQRDAVEAWETARRTARDAISLGRVRQDLKSGDALVDRAVAAIGGYGAIALCDSAWLHALERRFLDAYSESRDVAEARAALPHLAPPAQRLLHAVDRAAGSIGTAPSVRATGLETRHAQAPTSVEELLQRGFSASGRPVTETDNA